MRNVFLIMAIFLSSAVSYATIIDIPGDYGTIQEGIDASSYGDTVIVQPGIYYENINFNGHCIVLCSNFLFTGDTSFISSTIIDGNGEGRVITLENDEDSTTVIAGLTIQNGLSNYGGGIYADHTIPTIRNNIIRNNLVRGSAGGGIFINDNAKIINNLIMDNSARGAYNFDGSGGGISCRGMRPTISGNIITGNSAWGNWSGTGWGGGINCGAEYPIIRDNIIVKNTSGGGVFNGLAAGGGINIASSTALVLNNTIADNTTWNWGSGIHIRYSEATLINNIIWNNSLHEHESSINVTWCDIDGGWEGEGNIDADPLFVDPYYYNYNIYSVSPCIDAGDPRYTDPDSTRSDIGVFFLEHPSPGNIWYVALWGNDTTGTGEPDNPFRTIQHAINISFFEDTIIVRPGTYTESIDIVAEKILLASNYIFTGDTSDISRTIIENPPDFDSSIVDFVDCDTSLTLMGFTIKDGISSGIKCVNASPRIIRNKIQNNSGSGIVLLESDAIIDSNLIAGNTVDSLGGGIYSYRSEPFIINNRIEHNSANNGAGIYGIYSPGSIKNNIIRNNNSVQYGGGLFLMWLTPEITGNRISNNSAGISGGGIFSDSTTAILTHNIITENISYQKAGGLYCSAFETTILNNTVVGNIVSNGNGGGIYLKDSNSKITNTIVGGNFAPQGREIYLAGSAPVITYCNIAGGWQGYGNISIDPLFRNSPAGDFHLMSTDCGDLYDSPCIDAGHPAHADSLLDCSWGLGTVRSDIGAYAGGDSLLSGRRLYVPDDFLLIQEAINASYDGDTILVRPGVYMENIDLIGYNIVLASLFLTTNDTSYISSTIIDGDSSGSVVRLVNDEDSTTVICGFTLRNGLSEAGGGIYCTASPRIRHNIIKNNTTYDAGGGISFGGNNLNIVISDCRIFDNKVLNRSGVGGGISVAATGDPLIVHCEIEGNSALGSHSIGGGIFSTYGTLNISNSVIHNNTAVLSGGGIYYYWSEGSIENVIVYNNSALSDTSKGGGIVSSSRTSFIINNAIIWGNDASIYPGIYIDEGSTPIISYSNIQDTLIPGPGNISIDPLFRDPDSNNFHLMATYCGDPYDSPCIDAGDPAIVDTLIDCLWGLGTIRSDMGAYSGGDEDQTGIDERENRIPTSFSLFQNYPNPFNPSTTIKYQLPSNSKVKLDVYNLLGQKVKSLVNEWQTAGYKAVHWDASGYASGIYFYRLTAGKFTETKRMLLLK
ncbi:MAG: T9SS type A sorting domain-containing protein [candidate division Zixibacteria bacterium]|nr:T9SS type A sorting domain-containing protein [candidate division Zixibacteria bacterium]